MLRIVETTKGQIVLAYTGSPKTKNLQVREGKIVGYAARDLGPSHYALEALVELADGTTVQTHRVSQV